MDILAKSIIIVIAIVAIFLEFIRLILTITILVAITLGIAAIRSESNICAEHIVNSINGEHIEHLTT
jgi:hypothetical protein